MAWRFLIDDFISQIRLLTVKQKEPYLLMYRVLGFYPNRIEYYREALHHKSSPMVSGNKRLDNERLEFLGDAVLNVLVTDILYHHFKEANEGFLTKLRSRIVRRDKLNQIAKELGLDQLLINSLTDSVQHDSVYGNALEALVGAIYADKGYRRCKQFMEKKIFEQFLDLNDIVKKDKDFKSSLLEWSQKNKQNIQIPTEAISNAEHPLLFVAKVLHNDIVVSTGYGPTKKEAQQRAAKKALESIKKFPQP